MLTAETRRRGEEREIGTSGHREIWKSKTLPLIYTDNTDREEIAKIAEIAKDRRDTEARKAGSKLNRLILKAQPDKKSRIYSGSM